jgi:Uma2 family endonuclease
MDYEKKLRQYERAGVPEYWIVDRAEQQVTPLRAGAARRYRIRQCKKGELHSVAVPGFWLRSAWLWQRPLPKPSAILKELMARRS